MLTLTHIYTVVYGQQGAELRGCVFSSGERQLIAYGRISINQKSQDFGVKGFRPGQDGRCVAEHAASKTGRGVCAWYVCVCVCMCVCVCVCVCVCARVCTDTRG
jgi:hypothetical protein